MNNTTNEKGKKNYTNKIKRVLYFAVLALVLTGCSLSGLTDGNKSAVNGNFTTDETQFVSEQDTSEDIVTTEEKAVSENDKITRNSETLEDAGASENAPAQDEETIEKKRYTVVLSDIPEYTGNAYYVLNDNVPAFGDDELVTDAFETYSDLDSLGRCGVAYANICKEIMPTEERGEIGMVKPSGWHTVKYSDRIDGNYLYNRCHLIGYQLAGENANVKNLITGTRYLNVTGMLPFENEVAGYVESTGNHVLYRVTPIFDGDNLVASGVQMEAESVEDKGAGVCFNVYVYNVQPGVIIDYATGDSEADPDYTAYAEEKPGEDTGENGKDTEQAADQSTAAESTYIVNTNTGKFHRPDCRSVKKMKESNKSERITTRDELISEGYEPCKNCNP